MFLTHFTSGLYYKIFTIVIYDHNDIGQYYKTTIMIISYAPNLFLDLASVINYDRNWHHNLGRHLLTTLEFLWSLSVYYTGYKSKIYDGI